MFFKDEMTAPDIERTDHSLVLPNYDHSSDSTYSGSQGGFDDNV